jgi:hypothetical protein
VRIPLDPNLPIYSGPDTYQKILQSRLFDHLKKIATQLNNFTEGKVSSVTNGYTSAPTTGTYNIGDFVRNSAPSELGSASSKYVIFGWIYLSGGWEECRFLTGN